MAYKILPYALLNLYIQAVCGVFLNSIVYIGKAPWKSSIVICGSILQIFLSFPLIDRFGLVGLAIAQALAGAFNILAGVLTLLMHLRPRLKDIRPSADNIAAMAGTGFTLQFNSIAWMGFEMLTRILMSRFGGATYLGLFEVAYRAAAQVRLFFFYVYQSLSKAFTEKNVTDGSLGSFYNMVFSRSIAISFFVSVISAILFLPLSYIIFGRVGTTEIIFSICCFSAAFIHVIVMPVEMLGVALGRVRWNLIGTLVKVAIMASCGTILGVYASHVGVAFAMLFAVLAGGFVTLIVNSRIFSMSLRPELKETLKISSLRTILSKRRKLN